MMDELIDELAGTDNPQTWAIAFAQYVADNQDKMQLEDIIAWFNHAMTAAKAVQWRDDQRDVVGTQEMLGHVLRAVGGQVVITQEVLTRGHEKGAQIIIDEDVVSRSFIFRLEEKKSE